MALPTAPTVNTAESMTPDRLRAIIYGLPGAGKTTLAAGWYPETNLILDCDGGTRFLPGKHFVEPIDSYSKFMATVNSLVNEQHAFKTVTIDTGDNLFRMADTEAGLRGGKIAAGLVEFGKGGSDRDATFLRDLKKLLTSDLGVILLAHPDVEVTGKDATEQKIVGPRIVPVSKNDIRQEIVGLFDFELFVRKADHVVVTGGNPLVSTKRRVPLPDELPADPKLLRDAIVAGVAAVAA